MLEIKPFIFGPFETNTYVVSDEEGNVLLVDPACYMPYEQQQLFAYVESKRRGSLAIMATHGHLDHLWGASWACAQWQVPVQIHEADMPMVQAMQQQYDLFGIRRKAEAFETKRIQSIEHGIQTDIQIIESPGHTPGSICLYFPNDQTLLSGDTLFQMGYGRTDLPGGNMGQLIDSLERLFTLPPETKVYPGHGEQTTIGAERR